MASILVLAACGGADDPAIDPAGTSATDATAATGGAEDTLTFVSWGGEYQEAQTKAYLDDFEAETGVVVNQDGPTDYDEIVRMVDAGEVTWDVVDIEGDFGLGESSRYFEPIDYSVVPRDQILEGLADEYRVGVMQFATVIGYDTQTYEQAPQGWADFFDVESFPGTRALPSRASSYALEVALVADGVAPEDLYPLDVERATGVLDRINNDVVFWDTGAEAAQQLVDGDATMSMIWNGRIQAAIDDGAPLAIQWNQHLAQADYLSVPRGASDPDLAMELIAWMVSDARNARISDYIAYAPANVDSFDDVDPERAPLLPTYEDRPAEAIRPDEEWWDANRDATTAAYEQWIDSIG